jgi:EAL domain-containing protein (putative c-di-GMP-specific phosphodiesterase class I)
MLESKSLEEILQFKPSWNQNGLIPVIVQDASSLEILSLFDINKENLFEVIISREVNIDGVKKIRDVRINNTQDIIVFLVDPLGDQPLTLDKTSPFCSSVGFDTSSNEVYLSKIDRYQHRLTLDQIAFQTEIESAIKSHELYLVFQPQIDLASGRIVGVEALLRWKKDEIILSPNEFMSAVEDIGFMRQMGHFVMKNALKQAEIIRNETKKNIRMSVNVSPTQFADDEFLPLIKSWLKEFNFPSGLLEIEITENVLLEDFNIAIKRLKEFSDAGISIAMDDFGTGYSSLSYLRQLPIHRLKIDQSFVRDALENADDKAIARMIIALAKTLNLKVIAEGVETSGIERFLLKEDCDEGQGFYFAKPLPITDVIEFIKQKESE